MVDTETVLQGAKVYNECLQWHARPKVRCARAKFVTARTPLGTWAEEKRERRNAFNGLVQVGQGTTVAA